MFYHTISVSSANFFTFSLQTAFISSPSRIFRKFDYATDTLTSRHVAAVHQRYYIIILVAVFYDDAYPSKEVTLSPLGLFHGS